MRTSQSAETICCGAEKMRNKRVDTTSQAIFGWDKFNFITWCLLIVLFCVWGIAFFSAYQPDEMKGDEHAGHGGGQDEHASAGGGDDEHAGHHF